MPNQPFSAGAPVAETAERELGDPYELFFRLTGAREIRAPHAALTALRRIGPIIERFPDGSAGIPAPSVRGASETARSRLFEVVGYKAAAEIFKNPKAFSSRYFPPSLGLTLGHVLLHMDDPQHGQYRKLYQPFFSPQRVERWEHELIRPLVHRLLDGFAAQGRAELVKDFAEPLPLYVIARIIGCAKADVRSFQRWTLGLLCGVYDLGVGLAASEALSSHLSGLMAARRAHPEDDLISELVRLDFQGRPLEDEEILSFLRMLAVGGFETTFRGLGSLLFGLLRHPEQLRALRADPSLVEHAIEEGLRWETSDPWMMRYCTQDTEVCGVLIPAGSVVQVSVASANRDETAFDAPESFDIFRQPQRHLAFGAGPHYCLGARLSRTELKVALLALLERFPNLRLDPSWNDPHLCGSMFRGPHQLPVLF